MLNPLICIVQRCSTPGAVRWSAKPVEIRPLYTPSQQQPQGHVELWVDILAANEAGVFPPDDIALPPPKKFEGSGKAHLLYKIRK